MGGKRKPAVVGDPAQQPLRFTGALQEVRADFLCEAGAARDEAQKAKAEIGMLQQAGYKLQQAFDSLQEELRQAAGDAAYYKVLFEDAKQVGPAKSSLHQLGPLDRGPDQMAPKTKYPARQPKAKAKSKAMAKTKAIKPKPSESVRGRGPKRFHAFAASVLGQSFDDIFPEAQDRRRIIGKQPPKILVALQGPFSGYSGPTFTKKSQSRATLHPRGHYDEPLTAGWKLSLASCQLHACVVRVACSAYHRIAARAQSPVLNAKTEVVMLPCLRNLPKRSEMDVSKFKKHLAQDALAKSGKVLKRVVGKLGRNWRGFCEHETVAIKFEDNQAKGAPNQLKTEYDRGLAESRFSELFGVEGRFSCLAMELLGRSLEDRMQQCGKKLTPQSCVLIVDQILRRLEFLHSLGLIHRATRQSQAEDIKPENFMRLGRNASGYWRDKQHAPPRALQSLTGTARYASINAHKGMEQSRRDDLEAVGHMIFYFLRGSLPWSGLEAKSQEPPFPGAFVEGFWRFGFPGAFEEKYRKIREVKETFPIEQLCEGHPQHFAKYLEQARNLKYTERPDYAGMRTTQCFSSLQRGGPRSCAARKMFASLRAEIGPSEDHDFEFLRGKDTGPLEPLQIDEAQLQHPSTFAVDSIEQPDDKVQKAASGQSPEEFHGVVAAFEILSDGSRRAAYDQELQESGNFDGLSEVGRPMPGPDEEDPTTRALAEKIETFRAMRIVLHMLLSEKLQNVNEQLKKQSSDVLRAMVQWLLCSCSRSSNTFESDGGKDGDVSKNHVLEPAGRNRMLWVQQTSQMDQDLANANVQDSTCVFGASVSSKTVPVQEEDCIDLMKVPPLTEEEVALAYQASPTVRLSFSCILTSGRARIVLPCTTDIGLAQKLQAPVMRAGQPAGPGGKMELPRLRTSVTCNLMESSYKAPAFMPHVVVVQLVLDIIFLLDIMLRYKMSWSTWRFLRHLELNQDFGSWEKVDAGSKGSCLSCQLLAFYIVPRAMESVQQQSSPRWMLRNTFIEIVDDVSDSNGFSSCLMRANSDSVLYEGHSRRQAAEPSEQAARSGKASEESPNSSEESKESELDSWSDAETTPDTMDGEKSFPLPCYHHIADSLSGRSTPRAAGQYVAQTPSPRRMDWPATSFADTGLPTEEIRSDPMPDLVPPTHGQVPKAHAGRRDVPRHALQRLMAEVAQLEQENELLRRMAQEPEQQVTSRGDAQAVNPSQNDSGTGWTAVLMPAGLVPGSSSSSQMPFSAETCTSSYGPHSEVTVESTMPRRRRFRSRKGKAALEVELSLPRESQSSATQVKSTECDKPMEEWTTVMLRNLPNNYCRSMILALLDKEGFEGKYNFLYLPIDFRTRACMGYAFVNLVDPAHVPDFWAKFSGYSNWLVRSKKLCGVSWSEPHQGLESHVERYRNSPIMHESVPDEYRPIVLQNGVRVAFPESSKSSRPPRSNQYNVIDIVSLISLVFNILVLSSEASEGVLLEFKDASKPVEVSGMAKIGLFAFFVLTRAVHPTIIDASKSVDPETGKKFFAYGNMTVVLGETVVTLIIAQLMCVGIGGMDEWRQIWSPRPMKIFSLIGFMYALGDYLEMASMGSLGGAAYQILLQSKLIITALMIWGIKGTKQTALQWNILVLVMFSMCVYMLGGKSDSSGGAIPIAGVLNVLLKVTVSCLCAVLSDKYMKDFKNEPIYMQLVQFKCAWFATILVISFLDGKTWQNGFFSGWDPTVCGVLASFTIKGWSTFYLLALLDSVLKNIGEACAVLVIYAAQVALPMFDDQFEIPTFLSVMVVILSVTAYVGSKDVVEKAAKYDKMQSK
eukprot:s813_g28.t1